MKHHTEVKFYPEVKSQTGLCSLRVLYIWCVKVLFNTKLENNTKLKKDNTKLRDNAKLKKIILS